MLYRPWALIRKMAYLKNIFSLLINAHGRIEEKKIRINGGLLDICTIIKVTRRLMLFRLTKFHFCPF